MSAAKPLSPATVSVLKAMVAGSRHGFDVMDATGMPSGTIYPILSRLEKRGMVRSEWEDPRVASDEGRPPRKYYEIEAAGKTALEASLAYYKSLVTGKMAYRGSRG